MIFGLCNAVPKSPTPKQTESLQGVQWRNPLNKPLANMNKAMGLSHSVKDVISNVQDRNEKRI